MSGKEEQCKEQMKSLYDSLDREDIQASIDVIEAIGDQLNVEAVDVLIILLDDPDELIKAHAAAALGKLGPRSAVEPLINMLDDRSALVRESAVVALGRIGDNRAEIPLQKVPMDNPRVKRAAVNALMLIGNRRI